jgi:hypothetical protein
MQLISAILLYLSLPAALALAGVALTGLFAFGGARRNALALLATGVFATLSGAAYLYGVVASYYALQDNAYLGNLYLGLTLLLLGASGLLVGGLVGAGLGRWIALALALAGLLGLIGVYRGIGLTLPYGGQFVAVYLAVTLVTLVVLLALLRRTELAAQALTIGVMGAAVAFGVYALLGAIDGKSLGVYTQLGVDHLLTDKPPILDGFGAALTLLLAVAVFLIARRWRPAAGAQRGNANVPA